MNSKSLIAGPLLALSAWLMPFGTARADTVMYDGVSFVQGQQAFVQQLNISTPGTLTVTLTSVPWLDIIADLTGFLTTSSGVVGSTMISGSETFSVSAGTIYAHWFGETQGPNNLGVLGVKIVFTPNATPVPLPMSWLLLLSGLGVLFGWQRRQTLPHASV
jgi:MYXO-CTERM domain-containing protein